MDASPATAEKAPAPPAEPRLAPEAFAERAQPSRREVGKVIVGQRELVGTRSIGLLADGHVLLEGVPGLGKTLLVRTLADVIDCTFNRIQFTPDLMPADIIGTNIVIEEGGARVFEFQPGPIFANIVLADEINRATPKTQSACSRRCRSTRSPSPATATRSSSRSSSSPRRTRSRWRAPIRCPRPSSTASFQGHGPVPVRGGPHRDPRPHDRRRRAARPARCHRRRDRRDAAARPRRAGRPARHRYAVSRARGDAPRQPARARSSSAVRPLRRLAARRPGAPARRQDPRPDRRPLRRLDRRRPGGRAARAPPPHDPQLRGRGRGHQAPTPSSAPSSTRSRRPPSSRRPRHNTMADLPHPARRAADAWRAERDPRVRSRRPEPASTPVGVKAFLPTTSTRRSSTRLPAPARASRRADEAAGPGRAKGGRRASSAARASSSPTTATTPWATTSASSTGTYTPGWRSCS